MTVSQFVVIEYESFSIENSTVYVCGKPVKPTVYFDM